MVITPNRHCVSGVDLSNYGTCTIGRSVPELTRMMRGINHRGYRWAVDYLPKPRGRPRIAHPFVPRSGAPPSGPAGERRKVEKRGRWWERRRAEGSAEALVVRVAQRGHVVSELYCSQLELDSEASKA